MKGKPMNSKTRTLSAGTAALAVVGLGFALSGCATNSTTTKATPPANKQSGATLWAQNCGHCHNIRSPDSYSDAQWDVAMLHMRVRANLTAEEHKQILAFLKSAH